MPKKWQQQQIQAFEKTEERLKPDDFLLKKKWRKKSSCGPDQKPVFEKNTNGLMGDSYWDVLLVLRINRLFHPYISRLDTSPK